MMRTTPFVATIIFAITAVACGANPVEPSFQPERHAQALSAGQVRVIATVHPGADISLVARAAAGYGQINHVSPSGSISLVLPNAEAAARVSSLSGVALVVPDIIVHVNAPPCQPMPSCKDDGGGEEPPPPAAQVSPWGIDRVNAPTVWASGYRGAGVKVAVIDTGIDPNHADLRVVDGYNAINARKSWKDDNGHGTHVAGTIAALDNDIGVVGVAPDADLYAIKALDRNGSGWLSDIIKAVDHAVLWGADVINMSLGGGGYVAAFDAAIQNAVANGVTVVAAAGNEGDGNPATNEVAYPGAYANVIAVAATDVGDNAAWFSSSGPEVDLSAPGVDVLSTKLGGGTVAYNGTSMASPHGAGIVALMKSAAGSASEACVASSLTSTATDLGDTGHDVVFGHGLTDAAAAVGAVLGCP